MNDLTIFNSNEFGEIRTVTIDGKPYFVATDVATALGYVNPRKAVNDHCKGVTKRDTPTSSGVQQMSYINEGDLYRLIMKSKLPSAEKFESWVVDEVLPAIRKTGSYQMQAPQGKELLALAVLEAQKTIEAQTAEIERMKPKEIFADAVAASRTSILIGDLAKLLRQNGAEIRRFVDGDSRDVAMKPVLKTGKSIIHCNKGDQPHEWKFEKWQDWCCPVCGWFVGQRYNATQDKHHDQRKCNYCNECGQKLDWSDVK